MSLPRRSVQPRCLLWRDWLAGDAEREPCSPVRRERACCATPPEAPTAGLSSSQPSSGSQQGLGRQCEPHGLALHRRDSAESCFRYRGAPSRVGIRLGSTGNPAGRMAARCLGRSRQGSRSTGVRQRLACHLSHVLKVDFASTTYLYFVRFQGPRKSWRRGRRLDVVVQLGLSARFRAPAVRVPASDPLLSRR
jgi:hypothetical protein